MKTFLHGFVLILFALSSASVRGAVAANDVILTQRNSGNTTNVQSPVTATANAVIMYNATLVPVSKTIVAGDNITVTQNAGNITINSTASGSGNVTTTGATANVVMVGGGSTAIVPLASIGTAGHPLVSAGAGAPPAFSVLTVPGGGTGVATITTGAVILGNRTGAVTSVAAGSSGNILTSNGTAWVSSAPSGGGNVTNNASLTDTMFTIGNGTTGIGTTTVGWTAANSTITVGTAGVGNIIANVVTLQNLTVTDLNATNLTLTNPVPVAAGGTNLTTITANNIITGNGTGNPILIAPGTSGNILTSNGTAFNSAALTAVGGVTIAGGTNSFALTNGTTTANISGGFAGNIIVSASVSTTLPEIAAKVGFRGIPWVVANANVTTNATHNGKGMIAETLGNNTTTVTLNRTQATTDSTNGGFALSVFNAATTNSITVTASSGNIILVGSGNLTGGASAIVAPGGLATFTLANSTLIVAGSNVTVP